MTKSAQDCELLHSTHLYITRCMFQVTKHMLHISSGSGAFWDLDVLETAVCLQWVDILLQVHGEYMQHENSSQPCNKWVTDDDAAINGELPSGLLKGVSESTDADSHYGLDRAGWQSN